MHSAVPSSAPGPSDAQTEALRHQLEIQMEALADAQAELEESRHRYADLYDFAPVTYVTLDQNGWIREINLTGTALLGRDRRMLLGTPLGSFITKADKGVFSNHISRCNRGESPVESELRIQRKDGTIIPVQISSNRIQDTQHYRTILADLTGQKRTEEILQRANEELEKQVQKRTAALLRSNRALKKEVVQRQQLQEDLLNFSEKEKRRLGNEVHDGLCQQIAATSMMLSVLSRRLEAISPKEAKDAQKIAELLNLIMIEAKEVARGLNPVQLDSAGLMVALEQLAKAATQSIPCEFQCPTQVFVSDNSIALNLYRIAQEVISRAIKNSKATAILLQLSRKYEKVVLQIDENGPGNPPEGLELLKYHAARMGGSLRVTRRPGHGIRIFCAFNA